MDIQVKFYDFSHVYIECDDSIFYELRDYFSFFVDGYKFNPKFKYGTWSGKIYMLDNKHLLPFGLAKKVKDFADSFGYVAYIEPSILEQEDMSKQYFDEWLSKYKLFSNGKEITPHWYQKEAVYKGILNKRLILNLPTSAGKSLIQSLLSKYYLDHYEGKVLIIVPTQALVDQMINDFCDYKLFKSTDMLGIRAGTAKDSNASVYVSTWQSAVKQPKEWFSQFGMMINDECHLSTGKSISSIVEGLSNCIFKFGLSGSLKDGKANLMQYIGLFGEVYKPVSTSELISGGQVSELKINSIFLRYPDSVAAAMKGKTYQEEIKYVIGVKKRNTFISKLAIKLAKKNENVFLMFKHATHGKELVKIIQDLGYNKVFFVNGEISVDVRNALKSMAENETGIIIVASYGVFSTGISVKNLHHVILAHGVKSKIIVLQTIGRVLRKHGSKNVAQVFDIVDDMGVKPKSKNAKKKYVHLNYLLKHALERIQRYAEENFDYRMKTIEL